MTDIIVHSSAEAAFLKIRGHDYRLKLKKNGADCVHVFKASKRLEADRAAYIQDTDLQEFTTMLRFIKYQIRECTKEARLKRQAEQGR